MQGCPVPTFSVVLTTNIAAEIIQIDDTNRECNNSGMCHFSSIAGTSSRYYTASVMCNYSSKSMATHHHIKSIARFWMASFTTARSVAELIPLSQLVKLDISLKC